VVPQRARHDALHQTCVFESGGIYRSRSAFRCVWAVKCRHTNFNARVGPVRFQQKVCRDTLHRTCVFTSVGIHGSCNALRCVWAVKHPCTIFFVLRSAWCGFHQKHAKTHYFELVFCIQWDLWVMYCILVCLGHET
jgi:hypothetical protein